MSDDNVIDFRSLKDKKYSTPHEQEEAEMKEMMARLSALPDHMKEFVTQRFTFLVMYTILSARVAELLKDRGYNPDGFEPEEESTDAFLNYGPFFPSDDDDEGPEWNGPMFDSVQDEVTYRVATSIELEGEDGFNLTLDLLKREGEDENWQILIDDEWMPGPPDEYFTYLGMVRDWMDDEDDEDFDPLESVYDLDLSASVIAALARSGIETVEDLCEKTAEDLLGIKGIGRKSIKAIKDELAYYGLGLREL